jgi:hypothetical protein
VAVEWVQKKTRFQRREDRVHASATKKKWKLTVIQKYFFLEIMINVKADRVKQGARKVYHGRRVGQAWPIQYTPGYPWWMGNGFTRIIGNLPHSVIGICN